MTTRKILTATLAATALTVCAAAQTVAPIKYGDMDQWITRHIKESKVLGGNTRTVYEIGPTQTIEGSRPYVNLGGSPWATSNVYAKVMGVVKTSNAVVPADHGNGKCARLTTVLEHCKVLGMMNIEVLVSGSIFLGEMIEPITSTSNPYGKMNMGIPFTSRPSALQFDYKLVDPAQERSRGPPQDPKRHIPAKTVPTCSSTSSDDGRTPTATSTPRA